MFGWLKKKARSPNERDSGAPGPEWPAELSSPKRIYPRAYEDPNSKDYDPALVESNRAIGRMGAEIVRDSNFPDFAELVYTGVDYFEPHLIYRAGDSFLIVETELSDAEEEEIGACARESSDGQVVERGSREYLAAGIQDLSQRTEAARTLADALELAMSANRIRYVLVTVMIVTSPTKREVESVEVAEFDL